MSIFVTSAGSNKLFVTHLHKRAVNALYGQAVLYEMGDPKPLQGGNGTTMIVPKYQGATTGTDGVYGIRPLVEGTLLSATSAALSSYSGTVSGFGDKRQYSDFNMYANEIPQFISDEINDMVQNAKRKLDQIAIAVLSASSVGNYVKPDGSTVAPTGSIQTTALKQRALFDANSTLAGKDAIPYADGTWHGVFHPNQIHDLFVSTSGLNTGNIGAGYMEETDIGAKMLERASIGTLGNVKIYQSTWGAQAVTSAGGIMSGTSGAAGYQAFICAPGAFAKVDLTTARLKTYWVPANASTYDAIEQIHVAGVKFYATAIAMDTANRLVKVVSGNATF